MSTTAEHQTVTAFDAEARTSGVTWSAIFAGGTAIASISLILYTLGIGLGLFSYSPFSPGGISIQSLGIWTVVWLTLVSLIASGLGGYLTGRLRTKWAAVHSDEVFFRDTAHGFLAWSVAVIVLIWLTASMATSAIRGGVQTAASVGQEVSSTTGSLISSAGTLASSALGSEEVSEVQDTMAYFMNMLFRRASQADTGAGQDQQQAQAGQQQGQQEQQQGQAQSAGQETTLPPIEEVTRIIRRALADGEISQEDTDYVSRLMAEYTGLSVQEAEMRLQETFSTLQMQLQQLQETAEQAAQTAREATAYASLWVLVTMLIGAFSASFAATFGGKQRDAV